MAADALKGFLRLGFMVGGCGMILAFVQPPGTPQFILSVCSAAMGITLILAVIVVSRFLKMDDQP